MAVRMMKKAASFLVTLIVLTIFAPSAFAEACIEDIGDRFDEGEEIYILKMLNETSEHTGWNCAVLTGNTKNSTRESVTSWAEDFYNEKFGENTSGVLFLRDTYYTYVYVSGDAKSYINDSRLDKISSETLKKCQDGRDLTAVSTFTKLVTKYYDKGTGSDTSILLIIISVLAGAGAGAGVFFSIGRSYTVNEKPQTNNYLDVRSIDMYFKNDKLINTTYSSENGRQTGLGDFLK